MKLRDLVAGIATIERSAASAPGGGPDPGALEIHSISDDSRTVTAGALYVARAGATADGRAFVTEAIERGAVAVVYDASGGRGDPCPADSPVVRVRLNPRARTAVEAGASPAALAACRMAERLEGEPSEWLALVGITGTNGKTTMAYLVQQFVRAAGRRCGLVGTVVVDDGCEVRPATLTTPGGIEASAALGRMVRNGCSACAMEVSSHALAQGRASALRFRVGVFSNLTGDHLDYHHTMDEYAAAKARLFAMLPADGLAVVNADDPWHARMVAECRARVVRCRLRGSEDAERDPGSARPEPTRYGFPGPSPDECTATIHSASLGWQDATFDGPFGSVRVRLPLVGRHNAMNALEAAVAAHAIGVPSETIATALAGCTAPPGRLEPVTTPDDSFAVLVDYAHTDDALLNVLTALGPLVGRGGRLIVVFGCGGDRDRTKRPRMMRVACEHADCVIVTSDNPRTEDPDAIIAEVMAGRPGSARAAVLECEVDRERAIARAVQGARPGDIVLIAGKGHEDYQIIGEVKRPFDDRVVARRALAARADTSAGRAGTGGAPRAAGTCAAAAEAAGRAGVATGDGRRP